jgi:hypothetical protein
MEILLSWLFSNQPKQDKRKATAVTCKLRIRKIKRHDLLFIVNQWGCILNHGFKGKANIACSNSAQRKG